MLTKITEKLILNVAHHGCTTMKMFQSRSPKTTLNSIFFPFLSYWKTDLHLVPEDFYEKNNCMEELCENHSKIFLLRLCGIPYIHKKG